MKNLVKYLFLGLALTLSVSANAHAGGWDWRSPDPQRNVPTPTPKCKIAPEVDPSLAVSGFALLAGMLTVVRAKRTRR